MKLFAEKTDFENPLYCYFPCEEEFRDSAQIRFETENPSLQKAVKELFNDSPDAALCPADKYDNPNLFIDEIYLTLYGKPLDEMYKNMGNDHSWQNREKTGAKPWNKERVLSINWNIFIVALYTFYISTDHFSSDSWENLSKILTLLKDLSSDEWKRILFGKTTNYVASVKSFWDFIEMIVCKKYLNHAKKDATYVLNLYDIKQWISDKNCDCLQLKTYDYFVLQIDNEFKRLQQTQNISYDCFSAFKQNLNTVAGYNLFFIDQKFMEKSKSYFSHCFVRLGDICATNHLYELSNSCYVKALVYVNNKEQEKNIRLKNKTVCKHIPKNKQASEKEEKHNYRRMSDDKYSNKMHMIEDIGEKIFLSSLIIFALATIVFFVLTIIGLIFSNSLFAFSWKALLSSLGLTVLSFISLFFVTNKL